MRRGSRLGPGYWLGLALAPCAAAVGFYVALANAISESCAYEDRWLCTDAAGTMGVVMFWGGAVTFVCLALVGLLHLLRRLTRDD